LIEAPLVGLGGVLGLILYKTTLDVAGGGIAHTDGMGPAVPSGSAFGRLGSTRCKLGSILTKRHGGVTSEPVEKSGLDVGELERQATVGIVAFDLTPDAKTAGSAARLRRILRRIVLGTTRVGTLSELVRAIQAVGAHAATRRLLASLAGGRNSSARLLRGRGAGRLELFQLRLDGSDFDRNVPDGHTSAGVRVAVSESSRHAEQVLGQLAITDGKLRVHIVAVVVLQLDVRPVSIRTIGANEGP
jgi:hypothetical protein